MKITRQIGPVLGLAAAFSLAACGGGSSSGNNQGGGNPPPPAGPVDVTAFGAITGFGSVFVNGVKYEVAPSTIIAVEGEADAMGDDSALRLGMKVRVSAIDDNGVRTAQHIEFDEELKGPIESLTPDGDDPTIGTFSVMSHAVTVDGKTVFDDDVGDNDGVSGIDFRDLQPGMVVEVSGFPHDDGVLATRVDRILDALGNDPILGDPDVDGDELEVTAYVDNVASDNSSIRVGGVDLEIGPNSIFEDGLVLGPDLAGTFVEAKADLVAGVYVLVRLERKDEFDLADRRGEFEIEGVLEDANTGVTPNTFTIIGITVPVTDASSLVGLIGMRVEIEGSFNTDGVLVLREAELEPEDNVRTEDLIESFDPSGTSFTTRLGLVITPTGGSRVEDDTSDDGDRLTPEQFIGRLQRRDRMRARGHDDSGSGVVWTRVAREELALDNNDFECELRGPTSNLTGDASAFSFVIQGVMIETGRVEDNNFEGPNDTPIGRAEFFRQLQLQPGIVVEAESFEGDEYCMTGMLDARTVELEPADGS